MIDTGIQAYGAPSYTVCIVYMHMNWVDVSLTSVESGDYLGTSGSSGTSSPHLHYGIFLKSSDMSATDWNAYPLHPLMFYTPYEFVNG